MNSLNQSLFFDNNNFEVLICILHLINHSPFHDDLELMKLFQPIKLKLSSAFTRLFFQDTASTTGTNLQSDGEKFGAFYKS